jgi:uncharacterized protein YjbI with pentapeptide repeats
MRILRLILPWVFVFGATLHAQAQKPISYFSLGAQAFLDEPMEEIANAEELFLGGVTGENKATTLARIQRLARLTTLKFDDCDLSQVNENDPVPAKVNEVAIGGHCKISQGTIRWLAKFPTKGDIYFGCNVRGLEFSLGNFTTATFNNCEISRSAVASIVERFQQVTFHEVTLQNEK